MPEPRTNAPLPRGRHGLSAEQVADNQRRRLLDGAAVAVAEHGYAELTVAHVVSAAGVSRATFYAHYADKADVLLNAHRLAFEQVLAAIAQACRGQELWPEKLRAAVGALFSLARAEPAKLGLLTLQALATDPQATAQLNACNADLVALLRKGRHHTPLGPGLPDLTEEALIGAVAAILPPRLELSSPAALPELEREVLQLLLTPYVGAAEAGRLAGG